MTTKRVLRCTAGTCGIAQMGDQRNARRPESRVGVGAGNLLAELGRELAEDGGDVDADLLEQASIHHRHDAAAARSAGMVAARPRRAHETPAGGACVQSAAGASSSSRSSAVQMSSRNVSNQVLARALRASSCPASNRFNGGNDPSASVHALLAATATTPIFGAVQSTATTSARAAPTLAHRSVRPQSAAFLDPAPVFAPSHGSNKGVARVSSKILYH